MEIVCTDSSKVIQQVSKASSDQLLSKFAEIDSDNESASSSKRRRSIRISKKKKLVLNNISNSVELEEYGSSNSNGSLRVVERKSLLPPHHKEKAGNNRRCSSGGLLFKHLGVSRSHHLIRGARDFRTKALLSAIDKTWTKAIRGASKVFMEKHYNRHRILIDDIV